jgi:hypothetical protein
MEMDTELNNVIKDAEKEVESAVSIPDASDEPSSDGADAYGREFDSADYSGGDYMEEDYYGAGGYPGDAGTADEPASPAADGDGVAAADVGGSDPGVNDGDKTTAES